MSETITEWQRKNIENARVFHLDKYAENGILHGDNTGSHALRKFMKLDKNADTASVIISLENIKTCDVTFFKKFFVRAFTRKKSGEVTSNFVLSGEPRNGIKTLMLKPNLGKQTNYNLTVFGHLHYSKKQSEMNFIGDVSKETAYNAMSIFCRNPRKSFCSKEIAKQLDKNLRVVSTYLKNLYSTGLLMRKHKLKLSGSWKNGNEYIYYLPVINNDKEFVSEEKKNGTGQCKVCVVDERNNKIMRMRSNGKTLREIAEEFELTAERVRQITTDHDDYDEWLERAQRRTGQRMRYQTDEELLDALRELDKEINGLPTCEQIREKIEYNEGTNILCKRFGSSIEACERAGLLREDNVIVNNGSSFSDNKRREIRQDIEKANDRIDGGRLTCAKYNQVNAGDLCSISTIDMYYPSWCYALMDADLKPVQLPSPEAGKYTKADCMEAIQQANDKVNGSITVTQYRRVKRDCDPTFKTISRVTQMSWNELKRELGMEVNASKHDAKPD